MEHTFILFWIPTSLIEFVGFSSKIIKPLQTIPSPAYLSLTD